MMGQRLTGKALAVFSISSKFWYPSAHFADQRLADFTSSGDTKTINFWLIPIQYRLYYVLYFCVNKNKSRLLIYERLVLKQALGSLWIKWNIDGPLGFDLFGPKTSGQKLNVNDYQSGRFWEYEWENHLVNQNFSCDQREKIWWRRTM